MKGRPGGREKLVETKRERRMSQTLGKKGGYCNLNSVNLNRVRKAALEGRIALVRGPPPGKHLKRLCTRGSASGKGRP